MPDSAYLLVYHGSRDPRPQAAVTELADLFAQRMAHRNALVPHAVDARSPAIATSGPVETAYLDCGPLPLHLQIVQFCQVVAGSAPLRLHIVPLFLLAGVHVTEDIPAEVALAKAQLGDRVTITIAPHIGSHLRLRRILNERMSPVPAEAWILLAHGSRRVGANQPIVALAEHLGAVPAFWSVPPDLELQIQTFEQMGLRQIAILPYFLFPGGITDAIATRVEQLRQQFPTLNLHLDTPLAASAELADLLLDFAIVP